MIFLRWLLLRGLVNSAILIGLDDVIGERVDAWARRSNDLEHEWRTR